MSEMWKPLSKSFMSLLKPGGHLAIADLYTEDGSFHGDGFHGHKGFDPAILAAMLEKTVSAG
jgi:hypothetical protein